MPEVNFLQDLLVLFALGIAAVVAFHRFNLPPVLGFLITGVICGPFGFGLVKNQHGIEELAEIGLVLLLFTIGIEFSVKTFLRLKKFLLVAGGLQVGITIAATALITHFFGVSWPSGTFLGMLVALSSTAIVVRILEYRRDLDSAHGRSALSILIFQDLCIVPLVLITPFLAGKGGSLHDVALLSGKAVLFLVLAATVARYMVPWFLNQVARTKKREAFVLSIIFLCLGTANATRHFGLSMALGAFIAGLIISESKYNHQALGEVLPFREVFNCLVFVSIGMLFDTRILLSNPVLVVKALLLVIALKAGITTIITKMMGHSLSVSLLTGFALAQVSEFSFVLSKLGLELGLLNSQDNQLFLAVAILSMFLTPAALSFGGRLGGWMEKVLPERLTRGIGDSRAEAEKLEHHVIIVGFGIAGRHLASSLTEVGISYAVIEQDPWIVESEQKKGTIIIYGNASHQEILEHAGVEKARVLALTLSDPEIVLRGAELAKRLNTGLHIIARARHMDDVKPLVTVGAQEVIPEELVGSLELMSRVLRHYQLPHEVIDHCLQKLGGEQHNNQQALYAAHHPSEGIPCIRGDLIVELHTVSADSSLMGKNLLSTDLRTKTGITIIAVQRADGTLLLNPNWEHELKPGDSLLLLGHREQLCQAAKLFACEPSSPPGDANI
jgi:monovalent cation:H+ antiporter-2, CPA2 family